MIKTMRLAAGICVAGGLCGAVMADWPQYRGANTDAIVSPATPIEKLNLTPVWSTPLGDSFGEIAVAGDIAAAMVERGSDEYLTVLDAATGKEKFSLKIDASIKDRQGGNGPRTTPAIDGDNLYVYSTHMKLMCVSAKTGKQVWLQDVRADHGGSEPKWGNAVSPIIVDDLVIVTGGGSGKGVMAFDKATGKPVWAKTNEKLTHATPTIATIAGTKQAICLMQSGLVSVDVKNGDLLWKFAHPHSTSTAASPVVGGKDGDVVFVAAAYRVGAAACKVSKDGNTWKAEKLWRTDGQNQIHWSTPVHKDGYIYGLFGSASPRGPLVCLDIQTGEAKWTHQGMGNQGGIILLGDKLLIQTPNGDLVLAAASPDGYKELGRKNILQGKNWTAPSYARGMIFARNSSQGGAKVEGVCIKVAME